MADVRITQTENVTLYDEAGNYISVATLALQNQHQNSLSSIDGNMLGTRTASENTASRVAVVRDNQNPLDKYRIVDEDVAGTTKYYGFSAVNTIGKYYILRYDSIAGTYRYWNSPGATAGYETAWTNRATHTYTYIFNLSQL